MAFVDRRQAGRALATALAGYKDRRPVVLACRAAAFLLPPRSRPPWMRLSTWYWSGRSACPDTGSSPWVR